MPWATVYINDSGHKVIVKQAEKENQRPVGGKRGTINGFSASARRRMLDWLREMEVPDRRPVCLTLTTQEVASPVEWRSMMDVWRKRVCRRSWAGTWRVELQKRCAPHVHALMWLQPSVDLSSLSRLWCEVCGGSSSVLEHGCLARDYDMSAAWLLYVAGHSSKANQSGWMGKQWGIWNRKLFVQRHEYVFTMSHDEYLEFMKIAEQRNRELGGRVDLGQAGHVRVGQLCGLMGRGAVALAKRRAKEKRR